LTLVKGALLEFVVRRRKEFTNVSQPCFESATGAWAPVFICFVIAHGIFCGDFLKTDNANSFASWIIMRSENITSYWFIC
jgi:hypothetical protein